jgi:flagellar biosynthesis activator protein FlaF
MQQAATAYTKVAQATNSPRELEAAILMKAATRLQAIRDDWDGRRRELFDALTYNRKLWTILVSSTTEADNPLPVGVKQNVANLGIFIFNHTLSLMSGAKPEKLAILININRELAAGLRGIGVPEETVAAA